MAHRQHGNAFDNAMELLIENGFDGMANVLQILLNEAMKIEREDALAAGAYQRTPDRKGYANGYKPKTVDTRMGRITVDVPQVRGDIDFYPSALEKGCRSERALKVAIAEMYVKGISTRRVTGVLEKMCGLEISSMQVSRASKMLDDASQNSQVDQIPSADPPESSIIFEKDTPDQSIDETQNSLDVLIPELPSVFRQFHQAPDPTKFASICLRPACQLF